MHELDLPDSKTQLPVALILTLAVSGLGFFAGWFLTGLANCHIAFEVGPSAEASEINGIDIIMSMIWMLSAVGPIGLYALFTSYRRRQVFAASVALLLAIVVLVFVVDSFTDPLAYWQERC